MIMYVWCEMEGTNWEEEKWHGRAICRIKGLEITLCSCVSAMATRAIQCLGRVEIPIGTDWKMRFWVTLTIPDDRKHFLSDYPASNDDPIRFVWTHLDEKKGGV